LLIHKVLPRIFVQKHQQICTALVRQAVFGGALAFLLVLLILEVTKGGI